MKQKFKRLFIVFGVFLLFTLLLSIRTPAHAYTSSTMPSDYRLINSNDIGKSFGTDFDRAVFIATDELPPYDTWYDLPFSSSSTISFLDVTLENGTSISLFRYVIDYTDDEHFTFSIQVYDGSSYIDSYYATKSGSTTRVTIRSACLYLPSCTIDSLFSGTRWLNKWLYVREISSSSYTEQDIANARTEGYNEGYTAGSTEGYNEGYTAGVNSVNTQDYYNAGYTAGSTDGYNEGYDVGYQAGVDSIDTQDYYNQGYTAASDDFLVFENLIFGTMNGFTRTIQSLFDFQIFGISVFGLVGGLVGIAFGIGLIILIIKVVKIFT